MNGRSGGEAVVSMGVENDEMWERFLAFPDMDQDSKQSGLKAQAQR